MSYRDHDDLYYLAAEFHKALIQKPDGIIVRPEDSAPFRDMMNDGAIDTEGQASLIALCAFRHAVAFSRTFDKLMEVDDPFKPGVLKP